jgi:RimJ/RimL family protein N-acetyltransferase
MHNGNQMYRCLESWVEQEKEGYRLVVIRAEDVEPIRQWRNAQQDVLRQKTTISSDKQQNYFKTHIWPSFQEKQPKQILFSFLLNAQCIGYGGLTAIDWENQRAEISFLLNPDRLPIEKEYAKDFSHFLDLLRQVAFEQLNFHRLYAETFTFRTNHMKVLESQGFKLEGSLREHVYKKERWWDSMIHGQLKPEWKKHAK